MPWTPEQAREMGRKGGQRSGVTRRSGEQLARARLAREAPKLAEELLKAARGEPPYDKLDPRDRLNAVMRALEHGIGRPGTVRPDDGREKPREEDRPGLVVQMTGVPEET